MAKKYYAVKNGRHIGIYDTWDACKAEVDGFGGAEYKSFPSRNAAKQYITGETASFPTDHFQATAYVDGSFDLSTNRFSYGAVIIYEGKETEEKEAFEPCELSSMRNVAGEIMGAIHAFNYCVEHKIPHLALFYDYEGIEKWCTGKWRAEKPGTKAYKDYYDGIKDVLEVTFNKVKGHSGDEYNERVDKLAKAALGL